MIYHRIAKGMSNLKKNGQQMYGQQMYGSEEESDTDSSDEEEPESYALRA